MLNFVLTVVSPDLPVAVVYSLTGSSAVSGVDYIALPVQLSAGTNRIVPVVDLVEDCGETIDLSLLSSTNYYISGAPPGSILIVDHPVDGWRAEQFGTDSTNVAVSGDSANPDGDEFTNEEEWALVTDPLVQDRPAMNSVVTGANYVMSFDCRVDSDFTVEASWSWSLTCSDWRADNMTVIPAGISGDVETLAKIVSLDGMKKYIRLGYASPYD